MNINSTTNYLIKELVKETCNKDLVLYDNIIDKILLNKNEYIQELILKLNSINIPKNIIKNIDDNKTAMRLLENKLEKIKNMLMDKEIDQFSLQVIDKYLSGITSVNKKCDIIDIYMRNSKVIHLISLNFT